MKEQTMKSTTDHRMSHRALMRGTHDAISWIAQCASWVRAVIVFVLCLGALTGCAVSRPAAQPLVYDFGPGAPVAAIVLSPASLPALALSGVESSAALDSSAVLYRLAYADAQQLRPYALARWSMTPAQLVEQRVRGRLSQQYAVLSPGEGAQRTLHIELEEFSQVFEAPDKSTGLLRLRATVLELAPAGARLVAQRNVVMQRPAPSADAPGGVRALTAATDAAVAELAQWLGQLR